MDEVIGQRGDDDDLGFGVSRGPLPAITNNQQGVIPPLLPDERRCTGKLFENNEKRLQMSRRDII